MVTLAKDRMHGFLGMAFKTYVSSFFRIKKKFRDSRENIQNTHNSCNMYYPASWPRNWPLEA